MKKYISKTAIVIISSMILYSCSLTKRVPDGEQLLMKNEISKNGKKESSDAIKGQLYQHPNSNLFGMRIRLQLYNLAKVNADSSYNAWLKRNPNTNRFLISVLSEKQTDRLGKSFLVSGISNSLKNLGEKPVLLNEDQAKKSTLRLRNYYFNRGFFNTKVDYKIDSIKLKEAKVDYTITTGEPFYIDSLYSTVYSKDLETLYNLNEKRSLIKLNKQYNSAVLDEERERITTLFRDNGAYDFQKTFINYEIDTIGKNHKADINLIINDKTVKTGDSLIKEPFKIYTLSKVNVYTLNKTASNRRMLTDTIDYNGVKILSEGPLNYRPKVLTNTIFLEPETKYSDSRRLLTSRSLSNLRVFNYPSIEFVKDPADSTGQSLITNITLVPKQRAVFRPSIDVTHSNIQDFGILGSLNYDFNNVFKGAEILSVGVRGSIGSSASKYRSVENSFFDILEYGADVKLSFPRFVFFTDTDKILPRRMFPVTNISLGFSSQQNIGLDKRNLTAVYNYNWSPRRRTNFNLDLLNLQYVRNLNPGNYFNVYKSSYNTLNAISRGTDTNPNYLNNQGNLDIGNDGPDHFIQDVLAGDTTIADNSPEYKTVSSINERKNRLTENNLILASNITFTQSSRTNIDDNEFFILKTKIESAGNIASLLSKLQKNNIREDGSKTLFDVAYSQYIKGEVDFIKYIDLGNKKVIAFRAFGGIAIPYGNSKSIPFSRSYFAGGSNDNRAWQSYRLGPGSSGGINDFNEANMKLLFSAEYRFNLTGKWNLGLFADAGNIWNVLDNVQDDAMKFKGFESLEEIALGTGLGIRYDLGFFVIRCDVGFKTYNPGKSPGERWFKEFNLSDAVLNVGINYPF